ncbi:MAG: type II toxin-antitoxin system YafQ family toxin [Clostridiales bacterium]
MIQYEIQRTSQFKKDFKLAVKRGNDVSLLFNVIHLLSRGENLSEEYKDHSLSGNYFGYRECHIQPDWLLVYKRTENLLVLSLYRTGTHSDLF